MRWPWKLQLAMLCAHTARASNQCAVVDAPKYSAATSSPWDELLWPVTSRDFFESYAETKPLHVRRAHLDQYWDKPFELGLHNLEVLLEMQAVARADPLLKNPHTGLSQANCDAVREGMDDIKGNFSGVSLYHAYLNGATLVCNLVPSFWPAAAKYLQQLTARTGFSWMANLYATPSGGQGFTAHTDNTDGLVAQLYGSKHWVMHNASLQLPNRQHRVGRKEQPSHLSVRTELGLDTVVQAGDLVLVPRGWVHHAAATSTGPSGHLTISAVKVPTVGELVLLMLRHFPVQQISDNAGQFMHHVLYDALQNEEPNPNNSWMRTSLPSLYSTCLLYTSDAADEEDSVDLGGRRIIKKKKQE
eukprot:TRINITY_DN3894_c0_g1_i2.p1 TRINITY_DN3894_c0_g1~~TRINITY_DN3894_c0_g1_i2.p1  ORF type:complete len:359 (-),score=35.24 TRINITY_DN3894_c0_g1_i2:87-1163(-)